MIKYLSSKKNSAIRLNFDGAGRHLILDTAMDKMTKEQRSRCMSKIRGRDTRPELLVRKYLFSRGYRYRLNNPRLPGKPDIVLRKYRTAIFVNGCFWHGHVGCRYFVLPKSNVEFWRGKIERNRERDRKELRLLAEMGWHTIVVWECQLRPAVRRQTLESLDYTLNRIYIEDRRIKPVESVETAESVRPYAQPEETGGMVAEPDN